jgi:hypothetical protein
MCFSANVSFGAGAVLAVAGIACLKKVQRPPQIIFASIPLIFAFQQVSEGFVWLAAKDPSYLNLLKASACAFLFFAQILWPIWVPVSFLLIEKNDNRKVPLYVLTGLGSIIGLYHLFCLIVYQVEVDIAGKHIAYDLNHPGDLKGLENILYLLATVAPPFFSTIRRMWSLGIITLLAFIFTAFFFEHYVISVWCFFAAIISVMIWILMDYINDDSEVNFATW